MNGLQLAKLKAAARGAVAALAVTSLLLFSPSEALAQKKAKKEEAAPTKSYVAPYFITLMLVSVGLMTVCRPGKRKDRPDDLKVDE